jgi:hypothetical protein
VNRKQAKTRRPIFAEPTSATVNGADIEKLLVAVGCQIVEGSGSRVRFGDDVMNLQRPHPAKEAKRYQVRDAREFLIKIEARP